MVITVVRVRGNSITKQQLLTIISAAQQSSTEYEYA